ncbi:TlpA disulfide reductase family protein [Paenibacillus sp. J2TS4]|uniref:TlpA family protein disulfide reductase n=1 Tax=Paenibacillus sp. J2TS4 TaxID=2807194 RepID=UPI001B0DD571|nr:TlpA disulfide reductase family protein [Paenibacillus sp. J2TS4]GIP32528.1 thiol:disulfide interchange protein tlpA [Paenibacillus sp. J2TS4]
MKKNIVAILVLLGLVAYGAYDYLKESPAETGQAAGTWDETLPVGLEKGQRAPNFTLTDLEGNAVQLSDFAGKTVMVNFWATWCPPCRVEMPHMQKFYEDYKAKDVVILGVNMTASEQRVDNVEAFVKDEELTFPIVLDEKGEVMKVYQVIAYPTTYLLDSSGKIREKFVGAINYDIMKEAVKKIK